MDKGSYNLDVDARCYSLQIPLSGINYQFQGRIVKSNFAFSCQATEFVVDPAEKSAGRTAALHGKEDRYSRCHCPQITLKFFFLSIDV